MTGPLCLSLFPGIGLLDRAFELEGFTVVRGPDLLWGGDVRSFHAPPGVFAGIIGGPPCQDFSSLRRDPPTGYGRKMLDQFARIVREAQPEWFLCENVARVPNLSIEGYPTQRLDVDLVWFNRDCTRLRHIQFGSRSGVTIHIDRQPGRRSRARHGAVYTSDRRDWSTLLQIQGLPPDFDLPGFTDGEKRRAVGNGVPIPMGRALAKAVLGATGGSTAESQFAGPSRLEQSQNVTLRRVTSVTELEKRDSAGVTTQRRLCECGCGRNVTGRRSYYDFSCRKRAQRNRDRSIAKSRNWP